jgi:hypothetical protein
MGNLPTTDIAALCMVIATIVTAISNMYVASRVGKVQSTLEVVHTAVNSTASALAATAAAKDKEIVELKKQISDGIQREALVAQASSIRTRSNDTDIPTRVEITNIPQEKK